MRKQIIIASIILFFVVLIVILLSRPKQPQVNSNLTVTPTTIPVDFQIKEQIVNEAILLTPYETDDFKFDYSTDTNQLIVTEKTPQGREKFFELANQNNLSSLAVNPEMVVYENKATGKYDKDKFLDFDPINELFNLFINVGQGIGSTSTNNQSSNIDNPQNEKKNQTSKNQSTSTGSVYYAQCDSEYASLPLPDGCNMC